MNITGDIFENRLFYLEFLKSSLIYIEKYKYVDL